VAGADGSGGAGTSPKLKLVGGGTGTGATGWPGVSTLAAGGAVPEMRLEDRKAGPEGRTPSRVLPSGPASSPSVGLSLAVIACHPLGEL
jgi:hypothetical protein